MIGVVEGRADEVVHRPIDDAKPTFDTILDVDNASNEKSSVAGDYAAGLEGHMAIEPTDDRRYHVAVLLWRWCLFISVRDTEAAA